jgi:undecaprenyl-diphosphatase
VPNIDILIMAIIRGAAEVLPIDFSAHGLLVSWLICWPDRGNLLSAAADGGILVALLLYFWRDMGQMLRAMARILRGKRDPGGRLVLQILLGSLPAFVIVFILRAVLDVTLTQPIYVAVLLVAFAVVLYVGDQAGLTVRRLEQMKTGQAVVVGLFQGLAVLPGVSRVGIAITVARVLGYERDEAARFALLLTIPWMAVSGIYRVYLGLAAREVADPDAVLLTGAGAGATAFIATAFLMYWLRRGGFTLFAVYRVLLGGALIYAITSLAPAACS